jgi:hypothetical protein
VQTKALLTPRWDFYTPFVQNVDRVVLEFLREGMMNRVVVEGYQGGKLMVNERGHLIAFFSRRYEMGGSCEVLLGPVLDQVLELGPGEHLQQKIEGIEDICVCEPAGPLQHDYPEVAVYILSSYWHTIDMIVVSQERLRQAARWASVVAHRELAATH